VVNLKVFNLVSNAFCTTESTTGGIQLVRWGTFSVKFGSHISLRVHYWKRGEVFFTTLCYNSRQYTGQSLTYSGERLVESMVGAGKSCEITIPTDIFNLKHCCCFSIL